MEIVKPLINRRFILSITGIVTTGVLMRDGTIPPETGLAVIVGILSANEVYIHRVPKNEGDNKDD